MYVLYTIQISQGHFASMLCLGQFASALSEKNGLSKTKKGSSANVLLEPLKRSN